MPGPDHLMGCFKKWADGQIMGLEMLSIALGGLSLSQVREGSHSVRGKDQLFLAAYHASKCCLLE